MITSVVTTTDHSPPPRWLATNDGHFAYGTLCPLDSSPTAWSFRLLDTSPTGHFAYKTFRLLDSSPIGQFTY